MLTVAVSGCPDCTGGAFETGERGLLLSSEAARLLISGAWLWNRYDAHELDPSVEGTSGYSGNWQLLRGTADRANSS
jgi:hypothetical protein